MLYEDDYKKSFLPKIVFMGAISFASLLAGYLMFTDEVNLLSGLKAFSINGDFVRQVIVFSFCLIYVLRLFMTVFIFMKRKWYWREALFVSCLMSLALFAFAKAGGNSFQPVGALDYFAIFLFLLGSWLNTYSEYRRNVWKKNDSNMGRPYTEGLFKHSMHINFFGDIVLFTGFALITRSFSLLIVPLAMALIFIFFIIPRLDKYLAGKYGTEFKEYAGRTKKLIPWIY
ncbi:MAG: DUF1295 domain-containing protein [Calditrichaeota bacterium]|nr:DUF1295 domain-containing protein [Calditrichota bacterium]